MRVAGARPSGGWRYAEANRKGRGEWAMSSTEIAAMAHRLLPVVSSALPLRCVSAGRRYRFAA